MTKILKGFLIAFFIAGAYATSVSSTYASQILTFQNLPQGNGIVLSLSEPNPELALFIKNGSLWIALSDTHPAHLHVNVKSFSKSFPKPERLKATGGTLFRISFPADVFPVVTQEAGKYKIILSTRAQKIPLSAPLLSESILTTDFEGKSALLELPQAGQLIEYIDPISQEKWVIIPVQKRGAGLASKIQKKDFALLPTLQGAVILSAPHITFRQSNQAFYISKLGGLNFSPSGDAKFSSSRIPSLSDALGSSPSLRLNTLNTMLAKAKPTQRITLEWQIARQYLMDEQATEALMHLERLKKQYPTWKNLYVFQALRGTALFLKNQLAASFYTFSNPSWKGGMKPFLLGAQLKNGALKESLTDLSTHLQEVHLLPQPFQGNLLLLAAQAAIHADMNPTALSFIRGLPKNLTPEQKKYADTLTKQIVFEPLLPGPPSVSETPELTKPAPYLRHEAVLQSKLETLLVAHKMGRMTDQKLLKRLKKLQWASKNPTFEVQILKLMGTLYDKFNKHLKSLVYYRAFLKKFPKDPEWKAIETLAVTSYEDAILDPHLHFIQKIALFKKFPEFFERSAQKKLLAQIISQDLVKNHLVEDAATLVKQVLAQEVDHQLVLQLADTYILSHTPAKALALLDEFKNNFTILEQTKAEQLRINALSSANQLDAALSLLSARTDPDSILKRAYLLMRKQEWESAALELEPLVSGTNPSSEMIDALAICLFNSGQEKSLKDLFKSHFLKRSTFLTHLFHTFPEKKSSTLQDARAFLKNLPTEIAL